MRKVYLVHDSGKKYGPFGINACGDISISSGIKKRLVATKLIYLLGFSIEEVKPPTMEVKGQQ